jgi:signal transduction histidine kinase
MKTGRLRGRHLVSATVAIVACVSVTVAQAEPRQVLLLHSNERDAASHAFAALFRTELSGSFGEPIDFIDVALQAIRLDPGASEESIVNQLRSALPRRRLDLVVPIGGPAVTLAQKYRRQLVSATTPMLLAGVDRRFVQHGALAADDAVVAVEHDPPEMIESILRLLPDTKTIFVVIGASPFEQFWLEELRRGFQRFEGRVTFVWANALSFEEMLRASASLPPQSAIFFGTLSLDAKGIRHMEDRALAALHTAANAPIFGFHTAQLGRGIVGGPLLSNEDLARSTATVAARMLRGESPQGLTAPVAATPAFDWRELRRWGIGESRLQPGSAVLFRESTAWQRYRAQIIAGVAFASVQAMFVIALLLSLAKRRRKEQALSHFSRGLLQSQETERARIASQLNEDLCQRLTGLTLQLHCVNKTSGGGAGETARVEELCEQLGDLASEIHAVSDDCYSRLKLLGLAASARSLCQDLSARHGVTIGFCDNGVPDDMPDAVALALFRVLQEALDNSVRHASVRRMSVVLRGSRDEVQLEVADEGIGFDPVAATRSHGLGLISIQERLNLVGGAYEIASRPGGGTRIRARVPLIQGQRICLEAPHDSSRSIHPPVRHPFG